MIKVHSLDLTLAYILETVKLSAAFLPQVRAEACVSFSASQETKYSSSNCPNLVRRTESSSELN